MADVFSVAKAVCSAGNWSVSNLELQKIVYLAHMTHLGRTSERLVDTAFEAWDFGPVSPELYHRVKRFGEKPVKDVFFGAGTLSDDVALKSVRETCDQFLGRRASELVAITHWDSGAWAKNYVAGKRGVRIPDTDILSEYAAWIE
ncbi:MAG: type II toxin-antitoxin system antitoxin SocA domain-containing protein [Pseudomonadota bacterium]